MPRLKWFHILAIIVLALFLVPLSPVNPAKALSLENSETLVAITLDDGYHCWTSDVLPVLASNNLIATGFITDPDYRAGFTWADAQKLHEAGWEIGWHTSRHMQVDIADSADIISDFSSSKALFESHGLPAPDTFAYPAGRHDVESMEIAARYFKAARTVQYGVNTSSYVTDYPYHVKALSLDRGLSFLEGQVKKYRNQDVFIVFFGHTIGEVAPWQSTPDMTVKDFENLAKFLRQEEQVGNIDVVTFGEGIARIKNRDATPSWGLKFDSPFNTGFHLSVVPIPERYRMLYETIVYDFIGHRFPQAARWIEQISRTIDK